MSFDENKFIKLPIDSYMELLGVNPNSSQTALINAINNPKYRFVCAAISRRQGKTYIANIIGQLITLVPGSNVLLMSPNYSLSQISFELQRQLIKHFDLEVTRDNAKDKVIELSNGSTIRMGSVNQVDSVVGRSYDLIIFDEAALVDGLDFYPEVKEACTSTSFSHIFQGGYSSGYYSYKWAEVLDADAFEAFKDAGIFDKEVATRFKENILSAGGAEHPSILYKRFRGRDANPDALLRRAGLVSAK